MQVEDILRVNCWMLIHPVNKAVNKPVLGEKVALEANYQSDQQDSFCHGNKDGE